MPMIRWEDHTVHVMGLVTKLYENEEFTDCVLDVEGGLIHGHKTILAACSPYLKKLFMDHHEKMTIPFKEVKYNDMKQILDFIYFGEVDVLVADMASFIETAKLLQIMSMRSSSLNFSERFSAKVSSEGSNGCGVNKVKYNERAVQKNAEICYQNLLHERENRLTFSCQDKDLQIIDGPETQAINDLKELSEKVSGNEAKANIPHSSVAEMNIFSKDEGNFREELIPITFVAVSPASVKSGNLDDEPDASCVSDSQLENPLEEYPYDCDMTKVMNIREDGDFQSEYQIKMEIEDVCELDSKITENSSITKVVENSSGSGIVSVAHEIKLSCGELSTSTESNMLDDTEHLGVKDDNQNITFDGTGSSIFSEGCFAERTEHFKEEFDAGLDMDTIDDDDDDDDDDDEQFSLKEEGDMSKHESGELTIIGYEQDVIQGLDVAGKLKWNLRRIISERIKPPSHVGNGSSVFKNTRGLSRSQIKHSKEKVMEKSPGEALESFNSSQSDEQAQHVQTPRICEKTFTCDICGASFRRMFNLKIHSQIHQHEKPYSCGICDESFRFKINLKTHRCTHIGRQPGKPFSCGICDASFDQNRELGYHMRSHAGNNLFSCGNCKASFKRKDSLTKHMRTHSFDKPFSCRICAAAFNDSSNLNCHMRTHTREKPFSCGICKASYRHNKNLKEHMQSHTGVKPYPCGFCGASFSRKYRFTAHMRHHRCETSIL